MVARRLNSRDTVNPEQQKLVQRKQCENCGGELQERKNTHQQVKFHGNVSNGTQCQGMLTEQGALRHVNQYSGEPRDANVVAPRHTH